MAKKDNFDFDTDSKAKFSLDFGFLKKLTQKQKELILMIAIVVVLVTAIVIIGVVVLTSNNSGGSNGNNGNKPGSNGSGESSEGETDADDKDDDGDNDVDLDADPTQIYVASKPNKCTYYVGDFPNYSGLSIGVLEQSSSGFSIPYDEYPEELIITGFDSSAPVAEQTITVKYKDYETSFTIEIKAKSTGAELSSITVSIPKKEYKLGEALDYTGALLLCEYSDGSTKYLLLESEGVQISGFATITSPGEYDIKVEYFDDKGGYAWTKFKITMEQ